MLTGPATETAHLDERPCLVHAHHQGAQAQLLVKATAAAAPVPPGWQQRAASLEEIALGYLRAAGDTVPRPGRPRSRWARERGHDRAGRGRTAAGRLDRGVLGWPGGSTGPHWPAWPSCSPRSACIC